MATTYYNPRTDRPAKGGSFVAVATGFGLGLLASAGRKAAVQAITAA